MRLLQRTLLPLGLMGAVAALPAAAQQNEEWRTWNTPAEPYRIMGPLYSVGTRDLAVFLVATDAGHILINSGFEETPPLVFAAIKKLGFRPEDVKVLLGSHAHIDHMAGHALVQRTTGATIMVMAGDTELMETGGRSDTLFGPRVSWPPVKIDRVLHDGDTVALGGVTLTAYLTPAHTRGCTTWTLDLGEGGRTYQAVIVGSMTVLPAVHLVGDSRYPEAGDDFARGFRALKVLRGDVFLGSHTGFYRGEEKAAQLRAKGAAAGANPFVDPEGYREAVARWEARYREELGKQREAAGIVEDVPSRPDPKGRYVIYLHGRILEEQGPGAVSPDFGLYQYNAILAALAGQGPATVIAEVRQKGADGYGKRVAGQIRRLIEAGVPPGNITVVGASRGGLLALEAAAEAQQDGVGYVVLAGCGEATEPLGPRLRGSILSVYDSADRYRPSCRGTFAKAPRLRASKEIVVERGLDHGLLYRPLPEWLGPVTEWSKAGPK